MRGKKIRLKVVEVIPKEWETYDKEWKGMATKMSLFPLHTKGIYNMVKERGQTYLTFELAKEEKEKDENSSIWSFPMYEELIDNLKNGGSILVDETVLEIQKDL